MRSQKKRDCCRQPSERDQRSEEELIDLNNGIVERLRFLNQMRAHSQMLDFRIGDRVTFQPDGRPPLFGIITRYNRKTVTVITDGGQHWNVAPSLLSKVTSTENSETNSAKSSNCDGTKLIPSGNQLERLRGNRIGQYSIRINKQYRVCFRWEYGYANEVEITDYH